MQRKMFTNCTLETRVGNVRPGGIGLPGVEDGLGFGAFADVSKGALFVVEIQSHFHEG